MLKMNAPFTLVRPNHYVVTRTTNNNERVVFGQFLPLSKRSASQFAATLKSDTRVIMRKTAERAGLFS